MTPPSRVLLERDGAVARLVLNRPSAANAIDEQLGEELLAAALDCAKDQTIRCVVLTGAGSMFCAGGDLNRFAAAGEDAPRLLREITSTLHAAMARLMRMDKPLVTAVNGPAAGAGLGLALAGDIVLASPNSHFSLGYGRIGLSPDAGASWLLPRLIGLRKTQAWMADQRRLSAEQALQWGLITEVCGDARSRDGLDARAVAVALELAAMSTGAWADTRHLLASSFSASLESHLEAEARAIARQAGDQEFRTRLKNLTTRGGQPDQP